MHNILFITTYTGIGGGETLQLALMGALDRERYRLHLVTPRPGKFPEAAVALGVEVAAIPYRGASTLFVPRLWEHLPITRSLESYLRAHDIHAIMSDYHTLPFIVPAAERLRIPVLWNIMGWWFPIRRWQRGFFEQRIAERVAITAAVREKLLGSPPKLDPASIDVQIPGIDVQHFAPDAPGVDGMRVRAQLGIDAQTPLVALVGRFQFNKGHEVFQDAARHVLDAIPDARFVAAGDNVGSFKVPKDEAYKASILKAAQDDPRLRDRLTYLGFYPDVRDVIAAADVMVCSSYYESLSMTAMEAMAMARPMVSTRVGGPSETIRDGMTGYLVPPHDGAALAVPIIRLLRDPALRTAMGAAGRRHAVEALSVERYAAVMSAKFDAMIARR